MSSNFSVREVAVFGIISREKVLSTAFSQSMAAERFAKRVAVCIYVFFTAYLQHLFSYDTLRCSHQSPRLSLRTVYFLTILT